MDKNRQEQLFKNYPKIFRQKDLDKTQTCMCWGISTDNGWYWIIDKLCSHLQFNTDKNGYPQVEAVQVKEKFGGLRFYYNTLPNESKFIERQRGVIEGMVHIIEDLSHNICESCGCTENVTQTKGWIYTLCKNCLEKRTEKCGSL